MTEVKAAAGERVKVVRRAFSSVPMDYRFSARAARPGEALAGTVELKKSRWILPGSLASFPLQERNVVKAGFWDTFMSVDVIPAVEAVITVEARSVRHLAALLGAALAVIIVAAAMLVMFSN